MTYALCSKCNWGGVWRNFNQHACLNGLTPCENGAGPITDSPGLSDAEADALRKRAEASLGGSEAIRAIFADDDRVVLDEDAPPKNRLAHEIVEAYRALSLMKCSQHTCNSKDVVAARTRCQVLLGRYDQAAKVES